jgi:hypothetical protein
MIITSASKEKTPLIRSVNPPHSKPSVRALLSIALGILAICLLCPLLFWPTQSDDDATPSPRTVKKLLRDLDSKLQGRIVRPSDLHFEQASHVWNQRTEPPLAVVEVAHEQDVTVAIPILAALYKEHNIPYRIRSGGHHYAGWSGVKSGIILSLSELNHIKFHPESSSVATLGPAVRVQDILNDVLLKHNYSSVIGFCRTVAVGGYILGGGQGLLARQYGLGLDNLVGARLVLVNGTAIATNAKTHPDIFWALRGAGQNNFGVVTQMEYQFYPSQDEHVMANLTVPAADMPHFFHTLGELESDLPGQVGAFMTNGNADERGDFSIALWYACSDELDIAFGQEFLQNLLLRLAPSLDFIIKPFSWYDLSINRLPNHEGKMVRIWNGFLFPEQNTLTASKKIMQLLQAACQETEYAILGVELWGGAISELEPEATAFYWRQAIYNVRLVLLVPSDLNSARHRYEADIAKLDPYWQEIDKYLNGTYLNYAEASLTKQEYAAMTYGGNLQKLVDLKQELDPDDAFCNPQSVPIPQQRMKAE